MPLMPSPTHRHLNQSKPCVCSCRRHIFNKRAGRRTTAVRRVPPFVAHQHPTTSSRAHRACVLTTAATVACMRLAADRARQQPAETPYALVGRIRGSVVPSCRLAPPPVSPVPRHAITSFRAHRLAPPQTTRNCASRPKYRALPKARQDKCCVPQLPNFKPRWRRISTRQLTKALPKTRQVLVLRLAAHQLQRSAQVDCDATPLPPVMHAGQSIAQGKESARAASSSHVSDGSPHAS